MVHIARQTESPLSCNWVHWNDYLIGHRQDRATKEATLLGTISTCFCLTMKERNSIFREICILPFHSPRHAFVDVLVYFLTLFECGVMEQKRNT